MGDKQNEDLENKNDVENSSQNKPKKGNTSKLLNAINKGKVDIYFDFNSNISTNYLETTNGINTSLSILTNKNNTKSFNSIYGLFYI